MIPLVLVAHGSRDPRGKAATGALAREVAALRPHSDVRLTYLGHNAPALGAGLRAVSAAGHGSAVLAPLLLTEAYHDRVDITAALAELRAAGTAPLVHRAPVLGPRSAGPVDDHLLAALCRRLTEMAVPYDAIVLAAAGSRFEAARSSVATAAAALGDRLGVPCTAGYTASAPTVSAAVSALRRSAGRRRRIALASYFLAPGVLHDRARIAGFGAGAVAASAPLGGTPEMARLVLARADAAVGEPAG
ncbi:CbiX/SirB N-terminal domain-containing protein [Spirillospora sp. NPDC048819]|uniref:sirohydrochlorin chelatase n=1 Tax=Spirillospora sp. NPDC048819 TaxID=3155268 RepID=UPI0033F1C90C